MKSKNIELDVDFIGGQGSLIREEENQISEFIKSQKLLRDNKKLHKSGMTNKSKATA